MPVITQQALARYGRRVTTAVNAVSAQLTSAELRFLNWRIRSPTAACWQRRGPG